MSKLSSRKQQTTNTTSLQLPASYSNEENSKYYFSSKCPLLSDDYFATVQYLFTIYEKRYEVLNYMGLMQKW